MRLAVYGAASTVAGVGVVLSAFNQRANFYSAAVYLAQSNACLMILTNFLVFASIIFGRALQHLFYGPLRAIEVEQIYEKAWYAITETCLAMTIFRDEFDVRFIIMFGVLLFIKCFSWIGAGRVEFMEQQPPERPLLSHIRLASSLVLLCSSCAAMAWHSVTSVLDNGRLKPNMMIMFAFEFAILLIVSTGILSRYILSLVEKWVLHREAMRRRQARAEAREARKREYERAKIEAERRRIAGEEVEDPVLEEDDEDEDEDELDVGGWEEKGTWVFYSELCTDFLKLLTYLSFFTIVLTWYGLPLHIIRDVYLTLRSFITRIRDFVRYRRATAHMNSRYPDATPEEVENASDCIICREPMRPWIEGGREGRGPGAQDQRTRAKKLPCGHVLHFACLRSWLERQQRCPTCRRPVLDEPPNTNANVANPPNPAAGNGGGFQAQFGIGPLGFDIGVGGPGMMQNWMDRMQNQANAAQQAQGQNPPPPQPGAVPQPPPAPTGVAAGGAPQPTAQPGVIGTPTEPMNDIEAHIMRTRHLLERETLMLQMTQNQLLQLQQLRSQQAQQERMRQRGVRDPAWDAANSSTSQTGEASTSTAAQSTVYSNNTSIPADPTGTFPPSNLPEGVVLPPGWTLIPLTVAATATPAPSAQPSTPVPSASSPRFATRRSTRIYRDNLRNYHLARTPSQEPTSNPLATSRLTHTQLSRLSPARIEAYTTISTTLHSFLPDRHRVLDILAGLPPAITTELLLGWPDRAEAAGLEAEVTNLRSLTESDTLSEEAVLEVSRAFSTLPRQRQIQAFLGLPREFRDRVIEEIGDTSLRADLERAEAEPDQTNRSAGNAPHPLADESVVQERARVLREAASAMVRAAAALEGTLAPHAPPAAALVDPTPAPITTVPASTAEEAPERLRLFGEGSVFPRQAQDSVREALEEERRKREEKEKERGAFVGGLLGRLEGSRRADGEERAPPSREEKGKGRAVEVEDVKEE